MLDIERQFYTENLPSLLNDYRGRYIVVKEKTVAGPFATADEALSEGARRYGLQPFLVRLVTEEQPEVSIPALTLGLLHADPPHPIRRAG
jgi:hypothetical protein